MRRSPRIKDALVGGGLSLHAVLGRRLGIGFAAQCWAIAILSAVVIVIASSLDRTLLLTGRNVGLFQHPAIWSFLGLQVILPLTIRHSLLKVLRARTNFRIVLRMRGTFSKDVTRPILQFLNLERWQSRLAGSLFYGVGFAAFVWNTYQNQKPGVIVPYDFWDSTTFVFGFWVTRIYKLYLFCWLLPYVALIHVAILSVVLSLIRGSRLQGRLKLMPFHQDGVGGLGFIPGLITTPIIVTVLAGGITTAAAFEVHRAADVTPIIGLVIIVGAVILAYGVPILALRRDILAAKREMLGQIRALQQEYYSKIIEQRHLDAKTVHDGKDAQDYFERIATVVQSISHYPHLRRVIGFTGFAMVPSIISWGIKIYDLLAPHSRKL